MKKIFEQKNKACPQCKKHSFGRRGFTLVETLVAISIFSTSILALMSVLTQGISNTNYAKQKIVAGYLAQEGVEYIRNIRDTFILYSATSQTGWEAFNAKLASASCYEVFGCYFDDRNVSFSDTTMPMTDLIFTACNDSSCSNFPLLYDATTGKYNYDISGTNSGFTRKINITPFSSPVSEIKVSSAVYWIQGSGIYNFTLSENLFNWIE